jgi:hypothetical protein
MRAGRAKSICQKAWLRVGLRVGQRPDEAVEFMLCVFCSTTLCCAPLCCAEQGGVVRAFGDGIGTGKTCHLNAPSAPYLSILPLFQAEGIRLS